jgi:Fe-S-cluster containining protein
MRLADSAHQHFDEESSALGNATIIHGQRKKIACKAGCSHCCSLYVSATSSELLLIEGFISHLPTQVSEAIKTRIQIAYAQAKGMSMMERDSVRIRCPLLSENGFCNVYPVRPLTCRSYVSFDLTACKMDASNPGKGTQVNRSGSLVQIRSQLFDQLVVKERQRGYVAGSYELIQGLHTLLKSEGIVEDVCRGVDPMISARSR